MTALFGRSSGLPARYPGYHLTRCMSLPFKPGEEHARCRGSRCVRSTLDPLPDDVSDLLKWTPGKGVTVTPVERGDRVVGSATEGAYQLSSPFISVPAHHRLLLRRSTVEKGQGLPRSYE